MPTSADPGIVLLFLCLVLIFPGFPVLVIAFIDDGAVLDVVVFQVFLNQLNFSGRAAFLGVETAVGPALFHFVEGVLEDRIQVFHVGLEPTAGRGQRRLAFRIVVPAMVTVMIAVLTTVVIRLRRATLATTARGLVQSLRPAGPAPGKEGKSSA